MGKMKAFVTLLNMAMLIGFEVMFKSFLKNNPWFDQRLVILNLDLTEEAQQRIREIYSDVVFEEIRYEMYNNVNFKATAQRLQPTYFKLEMFRLDYERVVFIDSDTVILGNIHPLFFDPVRCIAGVKGYSENNDSLRNDINSGVVVVAESCLGMKTYKDIIKFASAGFKLPDQIAINQFFKGRIEYFNKAYNVEKRMENTVHFQHVLNNMKIVHYVAGKPWDENDPEKGKYKRMEEIWRTWHERTMGDLS